MVTFYIKLRSKPTFEKFYPALCTQLQNRSCSSSSSSSSVSSSFSSSAVVVISCNNTGSGCSGCDACLRNAVAIVAVRLSSAAALRGYACCYIQSTLMTFLNSQLTTDCTLQNDGRADY